jgi:hypothetical protein
MIDNFILLILLLLKLKTQKKWEAYKADHFMMTIQASKVNKYHDFVC